MTRLEQALVQLGRDIEQLGFSWALIGGLAVSAIAEPRTTKDVDVVVAVTGDSEAEAFVRQLQNRGYSILPNGIHERKDSHRLALVQFRSPIEAEGGIRVDLFFAWSLIEREIVAGAWRYSVEGGFEAPTAALGDLLALKLQAGRPRDHEDAKALLREASATDLEKARASLRLMRERGSDDARDLEAELLRLQEEAAAPPL